jgi:hypothetical protein
VPFHVSDIFKTALLDINKRKQERSSRTITRYDIVGIHCVMFICYFCQIASFGLFVLQLWTFSVTCIELTVLLGN